MTVSNMGNRQLQISRQLDAPLERVWEAWTEPQHIAHWWGPAGFTNTIDKMEVTEGGEWEFTMHGPDGSNYRNKHIYLQVTRNEKLVLDHITAPKFEMHVSFTPWEIKPWLKYNPFSSRPNNWNR